MPASPRNGPFIYGDDTLDIAVTDDAQQFSAAVIGRTISGGAYETAQFIVAQVLDAGLKCTIGDTDPTRGALGFELAVGTIFYLNGSDAIARFRFTNLVEGDDARLIIAVGF